MSSSWDGGLATHGAFLSLTITQATTLVEKMASNQGWSKERLQPRKRSGGMHTVKEVDMLSAKMDLLMKRLEDRANEKQDVVHIHDSCMTCEECGNTGHSGNNCPKTQEHVNFITTTTIFLNRIKDGVNNRGLLIKVTIKVIITITPIINHP